MRTVIKDGMCTPDELRTRIRKACESEFASDMDYHDINIEDVVEVAVSVRVTAYLERPHLPVDTHDTHDTGRRHADDCHCNKCIGALGSPFPSEPIKYAE